MRTWAVAARSMRAMAATAAGVGLAVSIHATAVEAAPGRDRPDAAGVVEAAHCRGRGRGGGGEQPAGAMHQHLRVTVPRTAVVTVDHAGRIVAAATNTGCRPSAGDDLYVRRPDGSIVPAPPGAFAGVAWEGDFRRGL